MPYQNLREEMSRAGVTNKHLAKLLCLREATISAKVNGHTRFYYDEAVQIKERFFPDHATDHLFKREKIPKK